MIKTTIALPADQPLTRRGAAQLAQLTSRFDCRIMIEHDQKIVNAKSMLGLLSLSPDDQAGLQLVADGPDEQQAVDAVLALIAGGLQR